MIRAEIKAAVSPKETEKEKTMRTVKQVSELTGISVRTLHYYDEIGLLKPSKTTEAGYRLYDDDALQVLQQILFFRELEFSLKDIQAMMSDPGYERRNAFAAQKKLIQVKRDRLDGLLNLLDRLLRGEECMSFKEFDMSEYSDALEQFVAEHTEEIVTYGGDLEEFGRVIQTLRSDDAKKAELSKLAVRQFGSIEKYTQAMKENMERFPEIMEQMVAAKEHVSSYVEQSDALMKRLTEDLDRDVCSGEIKQIVDGLVTAGKNCGADMDVNDWGMMADGYLTNPGIREVTDKKYGEGASAFIGRALKAYWNLP